MKTTRTNHLVEISPKGESRKMGEYFIDNAPDKATHLGAPVFDDTGEFVGMVFDRPDTCVVMSVSG